MMRACVIGAGPVADRLRGGLADLGWTEADAAACDLLVWLARPRMSDQPVDRMDLLERDLLAPIACFEAMGMAVRQRDASGELFEPRLGVAILDLADLQTGNGDAMRASVASALLAWLREKAAIRGAGPRLNVIACDLSGTGGAASDPMTSLAWMLSSPVVTGQLVRLGEGLATHP